MTSAPLNSTAIGTLNFERVANDLVVNVGTTEITIRDQYVGAGNVESIQFTNGGTVYGYALSTASYRLQTTLSGGGTDDVIASTSAGQALTGETVTISSSVTAATTARLTAETATTWLSAVQATIRSWAPATMTRCRRRRQRHADRRCRGRHAHRRHRIRHFQLWRSLGIHAGKFRHHHRLRAWGRQDRSVLDRRQSVSRGDQAFPFGGHANASTVANSITWSESGGNTSSVPT